MRRLDSINLDGRVIPWVFTQADLLQDHTDWAKARVKKTVLFTNMPASMAHGGPLVASLRLYPLTHTALRTLASRMCDDGRVVDEAVRLANLDARHVLIPSPLWP